MGLWGSVLLLLGCEESGTRHQPPACHQQDISRSLAGTPFDALMSIGKQKKTKHLEHIVRRWVSALCWTLGLSYVAADPEFLLRVQVWIVKGCVFDYR